MNVKKHLRSMLSILLALTMIISILPGTVLAAETDRTADTIFFATDRHEESSKLKSLLQALEYEPGLVVLGGDHVNNTNSGSLASITSEIQSVYPGVQTFYTYAAHDPNVSEDSSNPYAFARTGEVYEGEDYYVYGVDQNDMQSSSNASTASSNFKTWAASTDSSKVIFVMCHMPIHKRRNDNAGGATWMNALNEAGQTRDIVFLWGHNHTGESSSDTSVYFVGRGGTLTPQGGSTGTINFTYMNAGYIKNGYASMIVIDDDSADVTRYNTSGSVTASYTIERLFAGHSHNWQVSESIEATCTENGSVVYICSGCDETYSEVIEATGNHTYETVTVDATCSEDGSVTYTCAVCGDSYVEIIPATGTHNYEAVRVEATCTENGFVTYTCVCGNSYTEVIEAVGHNYGTEIIEAGCNVDGSITYTCTACGDSYVENIPATGSHNYKAVTVEATCTENGSVTYTCACGESYTEVIEAVGHNYEAIVTAATCTEGGYTAYTCTSCSDKYVADETEALGHEYETMVVAATCTEAGYTIDTCNRCGENNVYDEVAATSHVYTSVVTEPTCTEGGYTTYNCAICGNSYTADQTEALGHSYTTEETDGYLIYTCELCGDTYSEDLEVTYSYSKVSAFTSDRNYVITLYSNRKYYVLSHAGNTISAVQVTVSNNEITSEITEDMLWTYSDQKLSYTDGENTYYLYAGSSGNGGWFGGFGGFGGSATLIASTNNSSTVSLSSNRLKVGSYYLRYSNGSIKANRNASTAYLFLQTEE